jgi:glutamate-1-semialdehyde 2,1-aminomutase
MSTRIDRTVDVRRLTAPRDDEEFRRRAHDAIPGGAHTYSRGDDQLPIDAPSCFTRGKGGRCWDLHGRDFVDWGMGINNVLIGHAEDEIDEAAIAAIRNGVAFSRPTPLEVEAAEKLLCLFPGMGMVKFGKNGSDANTAAIRLARAITGRDLIAYDASAPFLSIHDWFIGTTVVNAGVPDAISSLSVPFTFNDPASVEAAFARHPGRIAVVVLEVCRDRKPAAGFLETVRRLCDEHGTLLLFDEIITGFRYALHGAHSLFNVAPDLMSVGKAMANGYALTALLGRRDYMERGGLRHHEPRVFLLSTTNGPEQSALAAMIATVQFYCEHDVIGRLASTGQRLINGFASAARRHGVDRFVSADSEFGCRPAPVFRSPDGQPSMAWRTLFLQETLRRGVFLPWLCPCYRHDMADIDRTLDAIDAACAVYAKAMDAGSVERFLGGPPVKPVFRKWN